MPGAGRPAARPAFLALLLAAPLGRRGRPHAALAAGWKLAVAVRRDLAMSPGKLAAQVGHAVHEAVVSAAGRWRLAAWEDDGARILVLQVHGQTALQDLQRVAKEAGVASSPVHDAGLTEVEDGAWTTLAVGPDTSARVDLVTGRLALYRSEAGPEGELTELRRHLHGARLELSELRRRNDELERRLREVPAAGPAGRARTGAGGVEEAGPAACAN
mmetsp:Transcript_46838/g.130433  ORF Transcript_46838/g.130433 Transcript_46838/m.130433 type:complete len:216 (-) Transcript_46838:255-902(-)